ncbi:MAG TPA: metallophosphoesterase [Tepidisphaeraceae bacterium]
MSDDTDPSSLPAAPRPSRRRLLRNLAIGLAVPAGVAGYARWVETFWPEFHELALPIRNLPEAFEGLRIAHLTDLHVDGHVPAGYVRAVVEEVNRLGPDLVFITGDFVTRGRALIRESCEIVAAIRAPKYVSFGNHDYGRITYDGRSVEVSDELERLLAGQPRTTVLRNAAVPLMRGGARLWVVGMEDLWSGRFSPARAFASVNSPDPVLALSHNPDTAAALDNYGVTWTLAGHTHGGQIRIPGYGAVLLPVHDRRLQAGPYDFPQSRLYISRGIGYLAKLRFNCRPEIPIFTLTRV